MSASARLRAPCGAVGAVDGDSSFPSGTSGGVYFIYVTDIAGFELQPGLEVAFNVKGVLRVGVSGVLVVGVLGDVVLIRQKRPHPAQLEDALAAVHDGQLILAHQRLPQFLIVERVGSLPPPALAGVVGVDGLLAQHGLQLLERGWLLAA